MKLWTYSALLTGTLGALFLLIPQTTGHMQAIIAPGTLVQEISLVGTKQPARNTVFPLVNTSHREVEIVAGDKGIQANQLHHIAQIIQDVSSKTLKNTLGVLPTSQTSVFFYSTPSGYRSAAKAAFPPSDVSIVVAQTGGFTVASRVYIPLYKYHDEAFLANTLTHELTHATFNELGIGPKLPTWLNEGLAWYNGTQAEQSISPTALKQMNDTLLKQVETAKTNHQLQPLSASGSNVLKKNPPYNTEFQDYLAVRYLIQTYGESHIRQLVTDLRTTTLQTSFQAVYPVSLNNFADTFTGSSVLLQPYNSGGLA